MEEIQTTHVQRKDFSYKIALADPTQVVELNFKLRTDVRDELEAFKKILVKSIADIEGELAVLD